MNTHNEFRGCKKAIAQQIGIFKIKFHFGKHQME